MASGECLLTSLLQAVQQLALRGCGRNWGHTDSPERWIWDKIAGFVTGMLLKDALAD